MARENPYSHEEDRLAGLSEQEVLELAEHTRILRADNWPIPKDSVHSFALARVLRISGAFGDAAAKKAIEEFGYTGDYAGAVDQMPPRQ